MSIFDSWSEYIAEVLTLESELAKSIVNHCGELGSAREALIQGVLLRILPSIYEVGTGEIVDHIGKRSRQIDIVIARRDFPTLLLPSGSKVYLIESVLATIEVKSKLNSKTLSEALENCASVADLSPSVEAEGFSNYAQKRGLIRESEGSYSHKNPLETARFSLLGRPPSYIVGFSGYKKNSGKPMAKSIIKWSDKRVKSKNTGMRHFPAVIVAEGLVAWRNEELYGTHINCISLIYKEDTPLRLLVLHLLYTLSRKIQIIPDVNGIVPNLDVYLKQMEPPSIEAIPIGKNYNI